MLVIIAVILFIQQNRKLKNLKLKLSVLEEIVEVPKEKEIDIDLKLVKRKILTATDSELTNYAQKLYWRKDTKLISNNFDKFVMLDKDVIEYGLVRANVLEDSYDLSKFFAPIVTLLLAFIASYSLFFQEVFLKGIPFIHYVFPVLLSVGCFIYLSFHVGNTRGKRSSIIFLKGLLLYAKEQQKQEKE